MDARREKVFTIPAGMDDDESEVKAKAVQAAVAEWGVKTENLRVECPQWHGPADRISSKMPVVGCYSVTIAVLTVSS
ncbi:MAG: hypothetical protein HYT47_02865 [Candidatus Vogelbacteria bacterium]|nr:hypothetical protein [Candidatus Vogelbacteria bacterium]